MTDTSTVQRFRPYAVYDGGVRSGVEPCQFGGFVRYDDYAALQAKLDVAVAAIKFYAQESVAYPGVGTVEFCGHDDNGAVASATLALIDHPAEMTYEQARAIYTPGARQAKAEREQTNVPSSALDT